MHRQVDAENDRREAYGLFTLEEELNNEEDYLDPEERKDRLKKGVWALCQHVMGAPGRCSKREAEEIARTVIRLWGEE